MTTDDTIFNHIRSEIADEYAASHEKPWIVGFSGGKDSTLVTHLVVDHVRALPRSDRRRDIHIVANDTLVESPLVIDHIHRGLREIDAAAKAFELPITTAVTRPDPDQTFWVNLIGRGYPSPNRSFRWCTDRMKIQPTSYYVRAQAQLAGEVILLLGVRRSESAMRAAVVKRYDNGSRLNKHNDLEGCLVFRPIVDLSADQVWEFLAAEHPPWGGTHNRIIKLYRDAGGGECPVVTSQDEAPSCGSTSSRFGCWTCTVVEKDRSLSGFVDAGFDHLAPLLDFRDWLVTIRDDPKRRLARRRDGKVTIAKNGLLIPGPFNVDTRMEILEELLRVQELTGMPLIADDEIRRIRALWVDDVLTSTERNVYAQAKAVGGRS